MNLLSDKVYHTLSAEGLCHTNQVVNDLQQNLKQLINCNNALLNENK